VENKGAVGEFSVRVFQFSSVSQSLLHAYPLLQCHFEQQDKRAKRGDFLPLKGYYFSEILKHKKKKFEFMKSTTFTMNRESFNLGLYDFLE
jgi:hypothetical protein